MVDLFDVDVLWFRNPVNSPVEGQVIYPISYKVLAPSQVVIAGFLNHQQYHPGRPACPKEPEKKKNNNNNNNSNPIVQIVFRRIHFTHHHEL